MYRISQVPHVSSEKMGLAPYAFGALYPVLTDSCGLTKTSPAILNCTVPLPRGLQPGNKRYACRPFEFFAAVEAAKSEISYRANERATLMAGETCNSPVNDGDTAEQQHCRL